MTVEGTKAKKDSSPEKKKLKARVAKAEARKAEIEARIAELDLNRDVLRYNTEYEQNEWDEARSGRHGAFSLVGHISTDGAALLSEYISRWSRLPDSEGKPITLTICSGGGNAYAALWLYDQLRLLSRQGHTVTTVIRGFAGSGAGVVAQAGDVRLIGEESFLHIHEAGAGILGKAQEIKDEALALEKMSRKIAAIYATRSDLSAEEVYAKFERREWWISSDEAIELGFADAVG